MAKRHKPPSQQTERPETAEAPRHADLDPSLAEQGILGNAALQARLDGHELSGAEVAPHDQALAQAVHLVEQALVALQLHARPAPELARLLEVVERSGLSAERKEAIATRLSDDQEAALAAERLVGEHLGALDAEQRSAWVERLVQLTDQLRGATVAPEGLSVEGAAEWVGAQVDAAALGADAEAVATLCRSIALWVHFDEDEEETDALGDYALEESGV